MAASVVDSFQTPRGIHYALGLLVSARIIPRGLVDAGIHSGIAASNPLLTERARLQSLSFAEVHPQWMLDAWTNVVFRDESSYIIPCNQKHARLALQQLSVSENNSTMRMWFRRYSLVSIIKISAIQGMTLPTWCQSQRVDARSYTCGELSATRVWAC